METIADANTKELYAALLRYSKSLTGSPWDAQDLAQDAWVKATAAANGASQSHPNPEALLLRIAKTTWIDRCRRQQRFARLLQNGAFDPAMPDAGLPWTVEEMFAAVLKHLTGKQRSVWLLADVLDYSIKEAAERLRMSEGAVKSALHRARQMMEAVRQELSLAAAGERDPQLNARLEQLSAAYRSGNVAALLHLLQEGALHQAAAPASLYSSARTKPRLDLLPARRMGQSPSRSSMRYAA
ncbi:RNA polymerase sigma factor [Paenibacillus sp. YN15]|uniref:RNA polymerase sigma factor n=1 Tax=Paenibacillus sp. YN15 TaxID=1742774 RepID=UPI000DCE1663|nr:RNA polymerase sigma factor [Paenibacillus sp. YN15]RAV00500.1 RNA polymerase sigma factor [Paenibacillus sp. YN15]